MQVGMRVEGLANLEKQLLKLGAQTGGKVLRGALGDAATVIQKAAKEKAPIAEAAYTKHLKGRDDSVTVQPGGLRKGIRKRSQLGNKKGVAKNVAALVAIRLSKKAFYGYAFEFGTSRISKTPFLRPAFDENKELAVKRFRDRLRVRILKAMKT